MAFNSALFSDLSSDILAMQSQTTSTAYNVYLEQKKQHQAQLTTSLDHLDNSTSQSHKLEPRDGHNTLHSELFSTTAKRTDASQKDIQYGAGFNESQLNEKEDLATSLELMTKNLFSAVSGIATTLDQEQHTLSSIEHNIDETQMTMLDVNDRLSKIVGGAWWDLFTNLGMLFAVLILSAIVFGVILTIPKAKWL